MTDARRDYWQKHYQSVAESGTPWLDFSNERVQLQSLGLALACSGNLLGQRCLDVGCGRGQLSRSLLAFGASQVVAFDMIETLLAENRRQFPEIEWKCVNVLDQADVERCGEFDRIFAMEVLQYVPVGETLKRLFERLRPGGRVVGMIPNADCPIVQKTFARFDGQYRGASVADLAETAAAMPDLEHWSARGLGFTADQRIAPYEITPWTQSADWEIEPNRLLFVYLKRGGAES